MPKSQCWQRGEKAQMNLFWHVWNTGSNPYSERWMTLSFTEITSLKVCLGILEFRYLRKEMGFSVEHLNLINVKENKRYGKWFFLCKAPLIQFKYPQMYPQSLNPACLRTWIYNSLRGSLYFHPPPRKNMVTMEQSFSQCPQWSRCSPTVSYSFCEILLDVWSLADEKNTWDCEKWSNRKRWASAGSGGSFLGGVGVTEWRLRAFSWQVSGTWCIS